MKKKSKEEPQTEEEKIAERQMQARWDAVFELLLKKDEEDKK